MKPLPAADLNEILDQTLAIWDRARGGRILLTGATGFFGIWLLESLAYCNRHLGLGITAIVLSRDPSGFCARMPHIAQESCIEFVRGDIRTFDFPSGNFEYLIHAAAPTAAAGVLDAEDLLTRLIEGTRRTLTLAKSCGTKKVLFVSSGAVYGQQPPETTHISEEYAGGPDWTNPASTYAEGKRVSEQLCAIAACSSALRFAIARCFAFVGPHLPLDRHFAIGNFIADAIVGRPIQIRGDGSPVRSYLYASDLAAWLWTLLLADPVDNSNPAIVNVGSPHSVSIYDLALRVAKVVNPRLEIQKAVKTQFTGPPPRYVPDVGRAERLYGLRQTVDLEEAIRRTAEWYLS